jgi:hypothetical protein
MADLVDAGAALVAAITAIAYPNGTGAASITGGTIVVGQGWPNADKLATDLAAGVVYVSVFPRPGGKVTTISMGEMDWTDDGNGTTVSRETRRQAVTFQITIWASCFDKRDPVASAIDAALSVISRVTLADGSVGLLSYVSSLQSDDNQKAGIYRRDLMYSLNFATVQTMTAVPINRFTTNIEVDVNGAAIGTAVRVNTGQ